MLVLEPNASSFYNTDIEEANMETLCIIHFCFPFRTKFLCFMKHLCNVCSYEPNRIFLTLIVENRFKTDDGGYGLVN